MYGAGAGSPGTTAADVARRRFVVAYAEETLREATDRMASHELGALPVVSHAEPAVVLGVITEFDVLASRQRQLQEERHRQRVLRFRRAGPDDAVAPPRAVEMRAAPSVAAGEDVGPRAVPHGAVAGGLHVEAVVEDHAAAEGGADGHEGPGHERQHEDRSRRR